MRIRFNSNHKNGHAAVLTSQQRLNTPQPKDSPPPCEDKSIKHDKISLPEKSCRENKLFDFKKPILKLSFCTLYMEDILLLALILVLINENCDEALLLALIYIFVSGLEK